MDIDREMFDETSPEAVSDVILGHLLLALIISVLKSPQSARPHIVRSLRLVEFLKATQTRRALCLTKVMELTFDVKGKEERLLLPLRAGRVGLPSVNLQESAALFRHPHDRSVDARLLRVEVAYFKLRIRPFKLQAGLERVLASGSKMAFVGSLTHILEGCLDYKTEPEERLSMAIDLLDVAQSLVSNRNFVLAYLALQRADALVAEYDGPPFLQKRILNIRKATAELREQVKIVDA